MLSLPDRTRTHVFSSLCLCASNLRDNLKRPLALQALQLCDDELWLHQLAIELALELGFTSKWFYDQRFRPY